MLRAVACEYYACLLANIVMSLCVNTCEIVSSFKVLKVLWIRLICYHLYCIIHLQSYQQLLNKFNSLDGLQPIKCMIQLITNHYINCPINIYETINRFKLDSDMINRHLWHVGAPQLSGDVSLIISLACEGVVCWVLVRPGICVKDTLLQHADNVFYTRRQRLLYTKATRFVHVGNILCTRKQRVQRVSITHIHTHVIVRITIIHIYIHTYLFTFSVRALTATTHL